MKILKIYILQDLKKKIKSNEQETSENIIQAKINSPKSYDLQLSQQMLEVQNKNKASDEQIVKMKKSTQDENGLKIQHNCLLLYIIFVISIIVLFMKVSLSTDTCEKLLLNVESDMKKQKLKMILGLRTTVAKKNYQ